MFRSPRLLSTARLCRSGQHPAGPGRFQACRRQSGQPNYGPSGDSELRYSRSAAVGLISATSAASLLGVLCLAKWSPKFRKWCEDTVPGSKSLFSTALKDRSKKEISRSNAAPKKPAGALSGSASSAAGSAGSLSAAGSDSASQNPVNAGTGDGPSSSSSSEIEDSALLAQRIKEQDELEEALRIAVLEEERRVQEAARLEAEHEGQRQRIEQEAHQLLEQSVKEAEERIRAEEAGRAQALQELAQQEKDAAQSVTRSLDTSLQEILSSVGDASKAMYSLAKAIREHSLSVYKVIELRAAHRDAEAATAEAEVRDAIASVQAAQLQVDHCSTTVDGAVSDFDSFCRVAWKGDDGKNASALADVANQALKQLHDTAEEVAMCRADQSVMMQFGDRMAQQCEFYNKEMERLNDIRYSSSEMSAGDALSAAQSVFNSDIQSLLSFAQQRVESMQDSLASGQQQDAEAVSSLLLQQRQEDMQVAQLKLDHLREQLAREHQEDLQQQEVQLKVDIESEVTRQLQRQAAAHTDHLRQALERQANEIGQKYRTLVENALKDQTDEYQQTYHRLAGSMKGLEAAASDAVSHIQQGMRDVDLCKASSALLVAVDHAASDRQPLRAVVERLRGAAGDDALIETALASIPEEALRKGVQSKATLKTRFGTVKNACSRVAFVEEKTDGNAGILTYTVAGMFSYLYWPSSNPTAVDKAVDSSQLDTDQVLQLAEECLQDNKLDDAVRLVNQLGGQARVLAQSWLNDARLFLSTQQAAQVVGSCALLRLNSDLVHQSPSADAASQRED
ncbi:MICOS complex subunit Mic60-like [Sycon ciliatum]|uniref:MICOS complex subunit Mic60-like n=1 Tax=Sycon ciliatum TaxID=27933 RepID=UPI0031F6D0D1|eukprot:scpid36961/ scgid29030/ Mitochondrial inner membrane protein; Mitofilin